MIYLCFFFARPPINSNFMCERAHVLISVQKARKAGHLPEDVYEVSAAASEAAPARHLEREGVRL